MNRADVIPFGRHYVKRAGVGLCHRPEAREVYTVRVKDVSRILGDEDSRVQHIFERSGASVGVMTDLRAMRHQNAHIEVTGTAAQVEVARVMIEDAIKEVYDRNPARLAMTSEYLLYDEMEIPLPKAIYLLTANLVDIETETSTWIEVDFTRPPRAGEPRRFQILLCGTRRNINRAILMIRERIPQVEPPKRHGMVRRACRFMWERLAGLCGEG